MRSRAAAAVLAREGFEEVYSMEGGIHAWKGLRATGAPDAGMAYFEPARKPEELIALAWMLEEGSRKFYKEMGTKEKIPGAVDLFQELSVDEEKHKSSLFKIYQRISRKASDPGFPRSLVSLETGDDYLEGGMGLKEVLEWSRGKELKDILEFSISLEANAIDLYIKMERRIEGTEAKEVFLALSNQERNHLKRLSAALENS
ncbi:MAG TPA: ferritin family protein [Thermodesulfobacteriota bacterium]|nr:ferritin family protein [Thermodesulfobacteriota bacterium]